MGLSGHYHINNCHSSLNSESLKLNHLKFSNCFGVMGILHSTNCRLIRVKGSQKVLGMLGLGELEEPEKSKLFLCHGLLYVNENLLSLLSHDLLCS